MSALEAVVAVVIAVGLVGVLVPLLPGSTLVLAGILLWAAVTSGTTAWVVFAVAAVLGALGAVLQYAVPGHRLRAAGISRATMVLGAVVGLVGFFVVPVVGLPLGFVAGVWLGEWHRLGSARRAGPATRTAVAAVGLGMLVELALAMAATAAWVVGVVLT